MYIYVKIPGICNLKVIVRYATVHTLSASIWRTK